MSYRTLQLAHLDTPSNSLTEAVIRVVKTPVKTPYRRLFGAPIAQEVVVLELKNSMGERVFGEAVPLSFRGESADQVALNLEQGIEELKDLPLEDLADIAFANDLLRERMQTLGPYGNTELAALSSALLSLVALEEGESVAALLSPLKRMRIPYAGATTMKGRGLALSIAAHVAKKRFNWMRVPMGKNRHKELPILMELMHTHGDTMQFVADFEGRLTVDEAEKIIPKLVELGVTHVEQPLPFYMREELVALSRKYSSVITFILDESVSTLDDFHWFAGRMVPAVLNLKLSKNGGYFQIMEMLRFMDAYGWQGVLGTTVGESVISLALGRVIAAKAGSFLYSEGGLAVHYAHGFGPFYGVWYGDKGEGDVVSVMRQPGLGVPVAATCVRRATSNFFLHSLREGVMASNIMAESPQ